ncbi:NTP transferase domain-containing protein [Pseudozobellia thermophila]|uniref:Probable molybdenum cofactor guanylyltransferase n=1 Tax=Pseudozobellia thermophila TaxID=192903 RepID=A0A1M6J2X0_9FLAO|nr:NTP transferase domain-containing protein [Pseudozobellia thermophila]SHJ40992.1 molybdenum cofactor guanylyltransferase [Pseudozobellia thermophila]
MIIGPKLYGLVLAGGKSTRMGKDKGLIAYHGRPQRDHLYDLLDQVCEQTFMGVRGDQVGDLPDGVERIVDKNEFRGPFNGLLSAHKEHPDAAWLVLACDLPLLDLRSLEELVRERDPEAMATTFAQRENPLPEPLCAIWEPRALKASIAYLEAGNGTCPRKFLINNEVKLVFPKNANVLLNANSEEDYKEAMDKLAVK